MLGITAFRRAFSTAKGPAPRVVSIDFADLVSGKDLSDDILEAYGLAGYGALTIRNIPGVRVRVGAGCQHPPPCGCGRLR